MSLLFGVLSLTRFYQSVSIVSFFVGVNLLVVGIFVQITGPLRLKIPSIGELGFILIYVSTNLVAIAGLTALFASPYIFVTFQTWRGTFDWRGYPSIFPQTRRLELSLLHPYAWLFTPLVNVGFCLFIAGSLLVLYNEFH